MGCPQSCLDRSLCLGDGDCCHTCAYYLGDTCIAGGHAAFVPRAFLRLLKA
jgi:hypothetical protein